MAARVAAVTDANCKFTMPNAPVAFALIGAGWRSEFFLRIARALPDRFEVRGMLARDPAKREALAKRWQMPVVGSLAELRRTEPDFVVVSVPREAAPDCLAACAEAGLPALCETPPAATLEGLLRLHHLVQNGAKIQVAEQYPFQPLLAAQLQAVRSGRLGQVSQTHVSIAHGYHGLHLVRRFLGVGFENAVIEARSFESPLIDGPNRNGPPAEERMGRETWVTGRFNFDGGKLGVYDFSGAQYFSWIRPRHLLVRGERGELANETIWWLRDFRTPVTARLERRDAGQAGNLEGYYHAGYTLDGEWLYQNPFVPGRLSDEEIAIAECLVRMAAYAKGGPAFVSLAEASQDHYLNLLLLEAQKTGQPVRSETQAWAKPDS